MGFQLVIAEGKEAGREFTFEQASVVIGRTSECDVVLYDPGVSRKHARIFSDGDQYFVEDMGSSNGTKVNGSVVQKKQLADGDAVALGPVVFNFSAQAAPEAQAPEESTRIVSYEQVKRQREVLKPADATDESLAEMERTSTRSMQAYRPRTQSIDSKPSSPRSLAAAPSPSGERAIASRATRAGAMSAAERARLRREATGLSGRARVFWIESSPRRKAAVGGGAGVLGLGLVALVVVALTSGPTGPKPPPEPSVLTRDPIAHSFGLGEGVTYERADSKAFEFEFNAPVKAVVILHYQAKDIAQGEVMVSINGSDVGPVPADTLAVQERSNEVMFPPNLLKKGEKNRVVFDNVFNPPKSDPWQVWNLWVEVNLLPELPPEQLLRDAQITYERAQLSFERRDVGAANRYEAWKDFRTVWLMLEAAPEPKPELYHLARDRMREAQAELDRTCSKLLLEARKEYNLRQYDKAGSVLDHVKAYFPSNDQTCPWRAEQLAYELELY